MPSPGQKWAAFGIPIRRAYEIHVAQADGGLAFSMQDAASRRVVSTQVSAVTSTIFMPRTAETLSFR